jgi:hypothetical protein
MSFIAVGLEKDGFPNMNGSSTRKCRRPVAKYTCRPPGQKRESNIFTAQRSISALSSWGLEFKNGGSGL